MSIELIRLYTWLHGKKVASSIDFATSVSQPMVVEALKYVNEKRQNFIRKARMEKLTPSTTEAIRCTHFIAPKANPHTESQIFAIHAA
jgi:hypothetical protein